MFYEKKVNYKTYHILEHLHLYILKIQPDTVSFPEFYVFPHHTQDLRNSSYPEPLNHHHHWENFKIPLSPL